MFFFLFFIDFLNTSLRFCGFEKTIWFSYIDIFSVINFKSNLLGFSSDSSVYRLYLQGSCLNVYHLRLNIFFISWSLIQKSLMLLFIASQIINLLLIRMYFFYMKCCVFMCFQCIRVKVLIYVFLFICFFLYEISLALVYYFLFTFFPTNVRFLIYFVLNIHVKVHPKKFLRRSVFIF